ncbi:hypothetical protein KCTC52924_01277 [Arenibacter antarcticus]|uniref:Uncharacterized protein n=1 Tax=Arenibacter antarcticus TaxID=2040469 RepID=A0ABW5VAX5_9FLAO|nr:hypothetical protein [Arenibacter sp. H213]MCM4167905.1 hypothetical protein [Arenibacter sp. H213]
MKKIIVAFLVLGLSFFTITSCRETKEKTVIIEKEVEKEVEKTKGILEKAGEKVDKKVNDKIDDAIDEIDNKK